MYIRIYMYIHYMLLVPYLPNAAPHPTNHTCSTPPSVPLPSGVGDGVGC